MPVLRLLGIYALVGVVVIGIIYRQEIGTMLGSGWTAIVESKGLVTPGDAVTQSAPSKPSTSESVASLAATHGVVEQDQQTLVSPSPTPEVSIPEQAGMSSEQAEAQVSAEESEQDSAAELRNQWIAARRAFHYGDVEQAEALYQSLIADYPDEIALLGELGDLYYFLGRLQEAADIYLQAGEKLIEANRLEHAFHVVSILYPFAPNEARILQEKLDKSGNLGAQ